MASVRFYDEPDGARADYAPPVQPAAPPAPSGRSGGLTPRQARADWGSYSRTGQAPTWFPTPTPAAPPKPATPPKPPTPPLSFTGGDPYAWIQQQANGRNPTTEELQKLLDILKAGGVNASWATSAGGQSQDKLVLNDVMYDFIRDVGGPNAAWQFGGPHQGGESAGGGAPSPAAGASFTGDPASQQLEAFLKWRFGELMQPAYTGQEQEVLRTYALDPIERDRAASHKRSLDRTSQRGFLPSSGLAELDAQGVDQHFDRLRAEAQGEQAYRTIGEQRSREQEAQQLLALLYELPNNALQQALAAMGMGPSPESVFSQMMGVQDLQNQNRSIGAQDWSAIGSMLPYLFPNLAG